jgi:hypothetical protein
MAVLFFEQQQAQKIIHEGFVKSIHVSITHEGHLHITQLLVEAFEENTCCLNKMSSKPKKGYKYRIATTHHKK